jgi:TPR repeat protein
LPGLLQKASGLYPSADAALAAFYALNACKFRHSLGPQPNNPADQTKPSQDDCLGITEKDWADAPRLLKVAADLGNENAQIAYARKEPLDGKTLEDFVQNPEDLVDFKNNANRYLVSASEAGNVDAMWFLSESLRTGDLMEKNLSVAYQYKYAISLSGGYSSSINGELTQLESQLTPEEVRTSQGNAVKFLARCCQGGIHR